jgi:hypothetical protein
MGPANVFSWAARFLSRGNGSPPLAGTAARSHPTTPDDPSAIPTHATPLLSTDTDPTGHKDVQDPVSTPEVLPPEQNSSTFESAAAESTDADPRVAAPPNQSDCQQNQPPPWDVLQGFATREDANQYVMSWTAEQGFKSAISSSKVNVNLIIV